MNTSIDSLKKRKIQVHHLQAGPEIVTLTVEMPTARAVKLGLSIGLQARATSIDSKEVDISVLGRGHFNPIVSPREGPLPELRSRSGRCAVATFEFVAVEKNSRPMGAEVKLRNRQYRILFNKTAGPHESNNRNGLPASVARVLPISWPGRPK